MFKQMLCLTILAILILAIPVQADSLSGLADITVVDNAIVSLRNEGIEYIVANGDLALGTTTRWYVDPSTGAETLWAEGDPAPAATVPGSSNPKAGDVGSNADNFFFSVPGDADNISSIDGIDFQQTIFPFLSDTFFVFERGGNDAGTFQAILADGSLGEPVAFDKSANGGPYVNTGIANGSQNAYGVVFKTNVPVMGVRITAAGHDTLSISAPAPTPILVDPTSDLAAANAEAQYGSKIIFAEGTYNITSQLELKDGVTYKGAGAGLTIIDGNNVTRAFTAWGDRSATNGQVDANGVGILNTTGPKDWVLEGMTIQNCVADTVNRQDILSVARDLLTNYTGMPYTLATAQAENGGVTDNPEWFDILSGGADDNLTDAELQAYLDANPVSSAGHLIVNDTQSSDGGAITTDNEAVGIIQNCEFLNNRTPDEGAGDDGGAINITGRSVVNINDCTFKSNSTVDDGGAVNINALSVVTVKDCLFDDNYAASADSTAVEGRDGDGGHIALQGGSASAVTPGTTLIANRCVFLNGNASDDGGAIRTGAVGSIVRLDACWFEGNTSWDNGNVLAIGNESSGELTVTNCVFANNITKADNSPDRMCEVRRNSRFINCTFVGNNQEDQDMIYNNADAADTDADGVDDELVDVTQVVNCLFLNNVVGNGDHVLGSRNANFSIAATNCLFFGNTRQNGDAAPNCQHDEVGSVMADPLLDVDLVPGAGSPAIDAGIDPTTAGVPLATDYNGNVRPQGAGYDVGAIEVTPAN